MTIKKEQPERPILGKSKHIKDVLGHIAAAAKARETLIANSKNYTAGVAVLIIGPTGTGKELIAKAIHDSSSRKGKPFQTVDCGAISPELFESELFGHVKGSFTGAVADKIGRAKNADGGSLFLDEIGNLSRDHQSKILRFLNDKTFTKVGGSEIEKADVRIITATNRDLKADSGFRDDLYHRIAGYVIRTTGLADRPEDTIYLLNHFNHKADARVKFLLYSHPLSGNVRELITSSDKSYDYLKTELAGGMGKCIEYMEAHSDMDFDKIVHAYEIVILRANTSMSNTDIAKALHIRTTTTTLTADGFKEAFSINLPDKDDRHIKRYKTLFPDFLGYWNAIKVVPGEAYRLTMTEIERV